MEELISVYYTADQVQALTVEQLRQGVEQRLYYDEFQWLKDRPQVRYRCRTIAEGLENILTLCPCCKEKYTLTTHRNRISCSRCGELTTLSDRYGFREDFCFAHPGQWYDWQLEQLRQEILSDPDYCLSSPVELRLPGRGDALTRGAGRGVCTLNRNGLCYRGTRDGEQVTLEFSMKQIYRLLFGAGENFEIYNGTEIQYFVPENRQSAVEWYMASMILSDEAAG